MVPVFVYGRFGLPRSLGRLVPALVPVSKQNPEGNVSRGAYPEDAPARSAGVPPAGSPGVSPDDAPNPGGETPP